MTLQINFTFMRQRLRYLIKSKEHRSQWTFLSFSEILMTMFEVQQTALRGDLEVNKADVKVHCLHSDLSHHSATATFQHNLKKSTNALASFESFTQVPPPLNRTFFDNVSSQATVFLKCACCDTVFQVLLSFVPKVDNNLLIAPQLMEMEEEERAPLHNSGDS